MLTFSGCFSLHFTWQSLLAELCTWDHSGSWMPGPVRADPSSWLRCPQVYHLAVAIHFVCDCVFPPQFALDLQNPPQKYHSSPSQSSASAASPFITCSLISLLLTLPYLLQTASLPICSIASNLITVFKTTLTVHFAAAKLVYCATFTLVRGSGGTSPSPEYCGRCPAAACLLVRHVVARVY